MMDTKTKELWQKIKYARACLELIQKQRTNLAGALSYDGHDDQRNRVS